LASELRVETGNAFSVGIGRQDDVIASRREAERPVEQGQLGCHLDIKAGNNWKPPVTCVCGGRYGSDAQRRSFQ
jgi:hypothetical protein